MKKLLALLLVPMMIMTFTCCAYAKQAKVMASFYPMYIFALNIFHDIDEITVECMTESQTGCLHDYQLVVNDMMKLAQSDLFIACGAGMEPYLEDIKTQFPQLSVIECTQGLSLLSDCDEEDSHAGHDHSVNPHAWLNIDNAIAMANAIADSGYKQFPEHAEKIAANANAYTDRLLALKDELAVQLAEVHGKQAITFHEGFAYFAEAYGIEVLATIEHESENGLQPAQLSTIIRSVEDAGAPPVFHDVNSASSAADTVAKETGSQVFDFDPIVSGEYSLTAYEDAMQMNASQVLAAFE